MLTYHEGQLSAETVRNIHCDSKFTLKRALLQAQILKIWKLQQYSSFSFEQNFKNKE